MHLKLNLLYFTFWVSIAFPAIVFADRVIVVTENYPPYNFEHEEKIEGVSTDIVKRIMDESGLDYEIKMFPWARAYNMALKEDNVLIYTIARTKERENLFHWIAFLNEANFYLMGRSEGHYESSLSELTNKNYKASCVINDAACEWLKSAGFDEKHIEVVPDNMSSSEIKMVLLERAEFFVADPVAIDHRLQQLGIQRERLKRVIQIHSEQGYYLAAGKRLKPEILVRVKSACDRLKAKGIKLEIMSR